MSDSIKKDTLTRASRAGDAEYERALALEYEQAVMRARREQHMITSSWIGSPSQLGGGGSSIGGIGGSFARPMYTPNEMIAMRMALAPGQGFPFDHLHAIEKPGGAGYVVFILVGGKPIMLEDEKELFPSDALITKLRILQQG